MKIKINNLLGIYRKREWLWSNKDPYKQEDTMWKELTQTKFKIESGISKKLWFKPKSKFKEGWYLMGIQHKGNNNRCYGIMKIGLFGFPQGRPMFPVRKRWRIIHLKRNCNIILTLTNIEEDLYLKQLIMIRIPRIEAWRRIRKRYLTFEVGRNTFHSSRKFSVKVWREYNKYLLDPTRALSIKNYNKWIKEIELKNIKLLYESKIKIENINKFKIIHAKQIKSYIETKYLIVINTKGYLSINALPAFSQIIEKQPNFKLLYTDEDCIDNNMERHSPNFKTAWNRELFLCKPNYSSIWVIDSKEWNKALKRFNIEDGNVDFSKIIREITLSLEKDYRINSILHIPIVLFHKKKEIESQVDYQINKLTAKSLKDDINLHSTILGQCKNINYHKNIGYKISWALPKQSLLSIIIPTRDNLKYLKKCLNSIKKYDPNIRTQIIIADNNSIKDETLSFFDNIDQYLNSPFSTKVIKCPGPFNYSLINNISTKEAIGNVILFLNNDVEFITDNWGYELSSNALRPDIGFVGAKLLFSDKSIQHAGVILGIGGVAGHSQKYLKENEKGYEDRESISQEYSALTGACLAVSKNNWDQLGGFDQKSLKINYNDIDICLRAREMGLRNIYLPHVLAYHHESKTRGKPEGKNYYTWKYEYNKMKKYWGDILLSDPYYSPNLTLKEENFSIGFREIHKFEARSNNHQNIYRTKIKSNIIKDII